MHSPGTLQENSCSGNDSRFPSESAEQEPAPSPVLPSLHPTQVLCKKRLTDPHLSPPASMALRGSKTSPEHYEGQTGFWVFCYLYVSSPFSSDKASVCSYQRCLREWCSINARHQLGEGLKKQSKS